MPLNSCTDEANPLSRSCKAKQFDGINPQLGPSSTQTKAIEINLNKSLFFVDKLLGSYYNGYIE